MANITEKSAERLASEKLTIKNREGKRVVVLIERSPRQKGLAFVMHGLSGNKEQPHIIAAAKVFLSKGYTVVRFDTTNTFGESEGKYEDATVTNYYSDLVDVIRWAGSQSWYEERFVLAGHSLGGICVGLYAERHPDKVAGLALLSSVVSGKLSLETAKYKDTAAECRKTGWIEEKSEARHGIVKRLKWSHMEDRMKYDLREQSDAIVMPVLFVVGDKDDSTPLEHLKVLFEEIPGNKKQLSVLPGVPHTYREQAHLALFSRILSEWIDSSLYPKSTSKKSKQE
ncbi:MAG TPA: alpha/beta hydrolase [Candidatus Nanoarchaeia archaeon]|nr:alpha/beta hydrolase [Candidatus Nanoarchaeia archaeon]